MSVDWFWPRLRIFARRFQGWSWNGRSYIHEWSKRKIGIAILIPGDIPSHLTSPNIRIINASWWVSFDNEQLSSNNGTYACTHFRFPLIWPWCHNATLEPHFPPFNNSAAYSCVFRHPKCPPLFSVLCFMLLFHPGTFASRAEQRFARRLISCTIKASAVLPSTISQIQEDDRTSPYLLRTLVSGWQRKDHCASPLLVTQPQSFAFGCSHAIRANQDAGSFGPGRLPRYLPIEDRTLCTTIAQCLWARSTPVSSFSVFALVIQKPCTRMVVFWPQYSMNDSYLSTWATSFRLFIWWTGLAHRTTIEQEKRSDRQFKRYSWR